MNDELKTSAGVPLVAAFEHVANRVTENRVAVASLRTQLNELHALVRVAVEAASHGDVAALTLLLTRLDALAEKHSDE